MQSQVFVFVFILNLKVLVHAIDEADLEEFLMELNMSELLRLKHSLLRMEEEDSCQEEPLAAANTENASAFKEPITISKPKLDEENCVSQNCLKPMAMALTGMQRGYYSPSIEHHDHHHHPWQAEEKPSKLTTLFNISITALSFLAFGGYLLCLIIHAIKSKGATFFYPVTSTTSTDDGGVRRIKVYRRGPREIKQESIKARDYGEFHKAIAATVMALRHNQLF